MEIVPSARTEIWHKSKRVGFIDTGSDGVSLVLLSKMARPFHTKAVQAAGAHIGGGTVVVSVAGKAGWLSKRGYAIDKQEEFRPRLFCHAEAKVIPLPFGGTHVYRHDGFVWKRKQRHASEQSMRSSWPALGFLVEIQPFNRSVRVAPCVGTTLTVSGFKIRSWVTLSAHDVIRTPDAEYVYLAEPAGRQQLSVWWMQNFLGGGWADPLYTRAVRTQAGGLPAQ